jgi:ADP-ribose pyrophosphatase YjhB (NUDIX family)
VFLVKTLVHVGLAADTPERIAEAKLPRLATKMLAEAFSERRQDFTEALLLVEEGKDGRPVYMTVDSRPPELVVSGRKIYAVWDNEDAQEPSATFADKTAAEAWMAGKPKSVLRETDAGDQPRVQTTVLCVIQRHGKVLLVKIANRPAWTFPEGTLQVGESIESCVRRTLAKSLGVLKPGRIGIAAKAPYINIVLPGARHFLTLCLIIDNVEDEPTLQDATFDAMQWFSIVSLPAPLFASAQQFVKLDSANAGVFAPPPPPLTMTGVKATKEATPKKSPPPKNGGKVTPIRKNPRKT